MTVATTVVTGASAMCSRLVPPVGMAALLAGRTIDTFTRRIDIAQLNSDRPGDDPGTCARRTHPAGHHPANCY
ncbi:hypothetical protein [Frankia sp. EAN1pec]|uniref:hypothetical protein n=1 Tax=Parafrankia sp. (strain EAN1pec) TaxID=298653 RepID=UPI0002DFD7AE